MLEIQFENAEKENKRLRHANVTNSGNNNRGNGMGHPNNTGGGMKSNVDGTYDDGMEMVSFVAEQSRIWRSLASHRLLTSMKPLPSFVTTLRSPFSSLPSPSSFTPSILSSSEPLVSSYDKQETKNTTNDLLKTYHDLRKLRSTLKIQQTKRNSRENHGTIATALTVCFHGQEKRRDRLIDFFT